MRVRATRIRVMGIRAMRASVAPRRLRIQGLILVLGGVLLVSLPGAGFAQGPLDAVRSVLDPSSGAQEGEAGAPRDEREREAPEPPGIEELVPLSLKVQREATAAESEIRRLGDLEEPAATTRELERTAERLDAELRRGEEPDPTRGTEVASFQERVVDAGDGLRERLRELEAIRSSWRRQRELWRSWRERLGSQGRPALAAEAERSLGRIDEVLAAADGAVNRALEVQRRLETLRGELPELARQSGLMRSTGVVGGGSETPTSRRDAPLLGSSEHREQLREGFLAPLAQGLRSLSPPDPEFWEGHSGVLALQILLFLAAGLLARHFRGWGRVGEEWSGILAHPWVLGAFVATAPSNLLYPLPPPIWRLALWTVFALSSAVLAASTFRSAVKRWTIHGLAGGFVLLLVLEVLAVPVAWQRLVVVGLCLLGGALLVLAARVAAGGDEDRHGFRLLAVLAAGVLAVTGVAEVLGFDALARGLLDSALATAFVVLAVTLLLRLGRGAIRGSIHRAAGRFPLLQRVGHRLAAGLSGLYQALLVLFALVELIHIWGSFPTPAAAFRTVWGAGVSIGGTELRLGGILLAILALYLVFLASTLLRSSLEGEVLAKRDLDAGVRTAISTLLHYLLVTVGFFLALSVLGVDLTSFALVVGALGVGVGLGLQDLVKNFFSGLVLLFERPVRVGDTVILDGEWATVKKIGLRATTVTTFDRSEIIVPNGDLTSKRVTNWTLSDQVSRLIVPAGVAYGSDVERVFQVLHEVAAEHPEVLEEPAPTVLFMGFGDSSLNFELRVWVGSIEVRLTTLSDLHAAIDRSFRDEGITIPFPQRDLHLKSAAPGAGFGEAVRSEDRKGEIPSGSESTDTTKETSG